MANSFSIKNVVPRLFNSSKYETNVARQSNNIGTNSKMANPFKNSDVQVSVLTADVFGTASKADNSSSIISKTKRMYSTFVGSINDMGTSIKNGIESIGAFCNRIKTHMSNAWNFLNETKIPGIFDAGRAIKEKMSEKSSNEVLKIGCAPFIRTIL